MTTKTSKSMSGHQRPTRGASDTWLTPPEIIEALGPFDLDPCCPPKMPWPTAHFNYCRNGLTEPWFGAVWMNPPFGPEASAWVERLAKHGDGIALVAARTETKWWHAHIWQKATAILFLEGRPHFHYPDGKRASFNSGVPIVLVAYGKECAERLRTRKADCLAGWFVWL